VGGALLKMWRISEKWPLVSYDRAFDFKVVCNLLKHMWFVRFKILA
jgi:hypothetical protein